jgi:penicillin-binding protein 1B
MKRAVRLPQYSNTGDFTPPDGVVTVSLDKSTNLLATPSCPEDYNSAFIEGSEPKETCDRADQRNVFQKIFGGPAPPPPAVNQPARIIPPGQEHAAELSGQPATARETAEPKKRGFWGKLSGIFKGDQRDDGEKTGQESDSNSR